MIWHTYGRETGKTLICLHGFMGHSSCWEVFASAFQSIRPGWQVAAPILPGHAGSDALVDEQCVVTEVLAWMDSHDVKRAAIAGYSLGGRLAMQMILKNPERFPVFIGMSTTAGIDDANERAGRLLADQECAKRLKACVTEESFREFLDDWWALPVFHSRSSNSIQRDRFLSTRGKNNPSSLADAMLAWSPGILPSLWPRLHEYPGRALILSGEDDEKYCAISDRLVAGFPDATSQRILSAGHRLLEERPIEVAMVLAEFLGKEQSQATKERESNQ
jgi:2-succinyl-6-hydroxy-2,4-cyclohexadiene-1-carboxylate synthase